jgi:hypothetical protein
VQFVRDFVGKGRNLLFSSIDKGQPGLYTRAAFFMRLTFILSLHDERSRFTFSADMYTPQAAS